MGKHARGVDKTPTTQDETRPSTIKTVELVKYVPKKELIDKWGRPKAITLEVLRDLKYAFLIGSTNREAALYAGISESTYYLFLQDMEEELKEGFSELVETWKNDMILSARQTMRNATRTPEHAKWLLERRRKDEFAPRTQQEIKQVSDFDDLSDDELEKIANAGRNTSKSPDRNSEAQK